MSSVDETILSVSNLSIGFETDEGLIPVIEEVSFDLHTGRTLALVGESGCGKSVTAFALLKLLPPFGRIISGSIKFRGQELVDSTESEIQAIRGDRISMIFQEPMSALNPVFTIGSQVAESLLLHRHLDKKMAWQQAVEMLVAVGIPDAAQRAKNYPHQLSGGMRQRVMIAMALSCEPDILIADEPTTALDVTIQAQILDLMHDLQERFGTAILFISHDFGVVSRMADYIAVMYAGKIIERGDAGEILTGARHPYTCALLATTPRIDASVTRLPAISGRVPAPGQRPAGCYFQPRCPNASDHCGEQRPPPVDLSVTHQLICHEVVSE
ncbi:MAG: ABC transporter ATP-binding protein [Gammaproteobacteria bacterium]|nr:ABC transporter ATP-binding protein [Gammaproteobacteria bacterium]